MVYKTVLKTPDNYRAKYSEFLKARKCYMSVEVFKDAVESNGLKGLVFREVERSS